jgi:hypothetical protein
MYPQLRHLADTARSGKADIRSVWASAGMHADAAGPIFILEFADQSSLVCMEGHVGFALVEEPGTVAATRKSYRALRSVELSKVDYSDFIACLRAEFPEVVAEPRDSAGPELVAQEQPYSIAGQ